MNTTTLTIDEMPALVQVRGLVAGLLQLPAAQVDTGALLVDLGLNSVDLIDLVVRLEADHGVQFDPARMTDLSCGSLATMLQGLVEGR